MQKQLPPRISTWLNERGITDSIAEAYGLDWNGTEIVIPVHDEKGVFLFNKYRRDPEVTTGPKYRYEAGSASVLYGLNHLKSDFVVVTEGEFDTLVLASQGINAVSSTGGSSTFKEEWSEILAGREVFVCYDNDKAGWQGAFRVQKFLPSARLVWLPSRVGEHGDITDYFVKLGNTADNFRKLLVAAKPYHLPIDWDRHVEKKSVLKTYESRYKANIDLYMEEARKVRANYESDAPIQILIQMYMDRLTEVQRQLKYFKVSRSTTNPDRILAAKAVPIPVFLKVGKDKTLKCIWHEEKTPSMHYYEKQNRVHCFGGCGRGGDVIDVVQTLNNCDLKSALQIILKDNVE